MKDILYVKIQIRVFALTMNLGLYSSSGGDGGSSIKYREFN
jgi:hypothetical protein